jgi:hypothetical protein
MDDLLDLRPKVRDEAVTVCIDDVSSAARDHHNVPPIWMSKDLIER